MWLWGLWELGSVPTIPDAFTCHSSMIWTPGRRTLACQPRGLSYTALNGPKLASQSTVRLHAHSLFSQKNRAGKNSKLFPKIWQTTRLDHTHMHRCAAHTQTRAAPRIRARVRCQELFWAQSLWQHRSTSVCHDLTHQQHKHHIQENTLTVLWYWANSAFYNVWNNPFREKYHDISHVKPMWSFSIKLWHNYAFGHSSMIITVICFWTYSMVPSRTA